VIHAKLLTYDQPLYLTAQISGGHGFSSEASHTPTWSPPSKIAALYLAPYLDELDKAADAAKDTGAPRQAVEVPDGAIQTAGVSV
jgi:hypothetical protein